MKKFSSPFLLAVMICSLVTTPLLSSHATAVGPDETATALPSVLIPEPAQSVPPAVQQIINGLFQVFNNVVIPFADKVNQWKNDAQAAAQKTVADFTGCPSPAAQNLYNDLRTKRTNLDQTIAMATQQDQAAQQARTNCRNQVPTNYRPACDAAYNGLPFAGIRVSAQAARNSVNAAMTALRNLRCISGCNQTASLLFPTVTVQPTTLNVRTPSAQVCTQWRPGTLGFDTNTSGTTLSATVTAQLPACTRTETVSACNWDLRVLLPVLQRVRLVPPEVTPANIQITVPNRTIRVVSGLTQSCSQPYRVCKTISTNANFQVDLTNNPLTNLQNVMNGISSQCTEWLTVGCSNPPFGLTATYQNVQVPDLTRAQISWSGGRLQPGSVTVDLTQAQFSVACRAESLNLPGVPQLNIGTQRVNFPFLCLQPQMRTLVANP